MIFASVNWLRQYFIDGDLRPAYINPQQRWLINQFESNKLLNKTRNIKMKFAVILIIIIGFLALR